MAHHQRLSATNKMLDSKRKAKIRADDEIGINEEFAGMILGIGRFVEGVRYDTQVIC